MVRVNLPKRLDLARDAERALDNVPGLILAKWVEQEMQNSAQPWRTGTLQHHHPECFALRSGST